MLEKGKNSTSSKFKQNWFTSSGNNEGYISVVLESTGKANERKKLLSIGITRNNVF